MVASLEAVQFVSNVIFGKCVLGAEITKKVLVRSSGFVRLEDFSHEMDRLDIVKL